MNAQFQKIKKWFELLFMKSVTYERQGIKPSHDWILLLAVTVLSTCSVGIGSYYLYVQIDQGLLIPVVEESVIKEEKVNTILLQKSVHSIESKSASTSDSQKNKDTPLDPSL